MLFDKLLELLTALTVAVAGIAGLGTASEHAAPPANDAALTHGPAQVEEIAAVKAATARIAEVLDEIEALGPTDGLTQAADSLTQAMDNAPDAADQGLDTAMEAVTTSPANDAPAGPPEDVPAGPPADLPGGRP
jgi:hypothetical protein